MLINKYYYNKTVSNYNDYGECRLDFDINLIGKKTEEVNFIPYPPVGDIKPLPDFMQEIVDNVISPRLKKTVNLCYPVVDDFFYKCGS